MNFCIFFMTSFTPTYVTSYQDWKRKNCVKRISEVFKISVGNPIPDPVGSGTEIFISGPGKNKLDNKYKKITFLR